MANPAAQASGVELVDERRRCRDRGGVAVGRPIHAGGRVEQAAGGGRVVQRRADRRERAVADVEGLAVVEPAPPDRRHVEPIHGDAVAEEPAGDERGVGARRHHLVDVAVVVDVVVADEHPAHVVGVDEREQVVEVAGAVERRAGVDHHRLGATDEHGVHVHRSGRAGRRVRIVDHERVGSDLERFDAGRRRRDGRRSGRGVDQVRHAGHHPDRCRRRPSRPAGEFPTGSPGMPHVARYRGWPTPLIRGALRDRSPGRVDAGRPPGTWDGARRCGAAR
jgi:hypothetical protein